MILTPDDLKFEECRPITDETWLQLQDAMRDMIIAQLMTKMELAQIFDGIANSMSTTS